MDGDKAENPVPANALLISDNLVLMIDDARPMTGGVFFVGPTVFSAASGQAGGRLTPGGNLSSVQVEGLARLPGGRPRPATTAAI